jgi:proteasome lid subunit RPN8/RPN11
MDSDIHFGEVEEAGSGGRRRRPDRDRHYAVAACGRPRENDLPIFVALDAMLDMEIHAQSNTNVELGGVLLGGRFEDEEGRPYVFIQDSLRAEHYEATKGSFKFTHDTWTAITRQREEFSPDLEMVGWYHTHPGWGVFLSGMDTFICDHFFNKPLDVALVIDPCRGDRGFFQWGADARQRLRRTAGFYLAASRFRQDEVEAYAACLEGDATMKSEGGYAPRASGALPGSPVVHIHDQRGGGTNAAVIGLVAAQFCLTLLVAVWLIVSAGSREPVAGPNAAPPAIERWLVEREEAVRIKEAQLAAQRELLDAMVGRVKEAPDGVVTELMAERTRSEALASAVAGQEFRLRELSSESAGLAKSVDSLKAELTRRDATISGLVSDLKAARASVTELHKQIAALKAPATDPAESEIEAAGPGWTWIHYTIAAIAAMLIGLGVAIAFARRPVVAGAADEEPPHSDAPSASGAGKS